MFVIDTHWADEGAVRSPSVWINPEITQRAGSVVWEEGCLSVPDYTADVERFESVTLRAIDLDGKEIVEEAEGLQAICIQHEIDHLDGILFIDRISRLKRSLYVKKRKKQLAAEAEE
jgi:peptide deformylase